MISSVEPQRPTHPTSASPRPAATVLLLRDSDAGPEVFMQKRREQMVFGNNWVLPGGSTHLHDGAAEILATLSPVVRTRCCTRLNAHVQLHLSEQDAVAQYIAACRETFEECGVLLARHADGSAIETEEIERLQKWRDLLDQRSILVEMLTNEQLVLEVDALVFWAHWITPSWRPKRFDTRFFAAAMPAKQAAREDVRESTEHGWFNIAAIAGSENDPLDLMPPTRLTLMEVLESFDRHGSVQRLLQAEMSRQVFPILSRVLNRAGQTWTIQPWDPEYSSAMGEGLESRVEEMPERLRRLPSRAIIKR